MLSLGLSLISALERTSRDSLRPLVTNARMRSLRRLPMVMAGSLRPEREA
jgi:hypothetical protein